MRHLLRNSSTRAYVRSSVPAYNPQANDQKTKQWTARLNSLASSGPSKSYLSQLGALLNYYNRVVTDTRKDIEWDKWKSRIISEGLVDKVKNNYEEQSAQEYNLDAVFNEIFSKDSKALDQINNQMAFHTAVWLDNYAEYIRFLDDLNSTSAPMDYNYIQYMDMHPGYEVQGERLTQTHHYFPGATDDVNLHGYMSNQFAWGKKVITFYRHPADDFKGGRATKNSMGR